METSPSSHKTCDTIPAPQNLSRPVGPRQLDGRKLHPVNIDKHEQNPDNAQAALNTPVDADVTSLGRGPVSTPVDQRHLCMRHSRTADESTSLKLQRSLDALPIHDRKTINTLWTMFSSSTHAHRAVILQGLLTMCCSSQLSLLSEQVPRLLRIDPFFVLPHEVSLRLLKFLDATSLARAAQVSRTWRSLADDDILWRNMCEQHIEKKCAKCGWGLPLLEKKRSRASRPTLRTDSSSSLSATRANLDTNNNASTRKRSNPSDDEGTISDGPGPDHSTHDSAFKRRKLLESHAAAFGSQLARPSPGYTQTPSLSSSESSTFPLGPLLTLDLPLPTVTRPWKDVYSERLTLERNWRRGRFSVTTLQGHTDGVMCLQLNENLSHPDFPVLISGSYDRTVRVWNLETGQQVGCLRGHTRAVRALQFDEVKLITASMDRTLRVWNWRTGACIRVLEGHSEGVVSLTFDADVLASGSVDTTVKVWNFRTGDCFTLRGHRDWVNAVTLWDGRTSAPSHHDFERAVSPSLSARGAGDTTGGIDSVGKMLFSASDDGSIRLWDLHTRSCIRELTGHNGQVQSIQLAFIEGDGGDDEEETVLDDKSPSPRSSSVTLQSTSQQHQQKSAAATTALGDITSKYRGPRALLISGSLDNTLKLWDIESGQDIQTYFGHIEGVWGIACDKLRIVSASHDRTIKIWDREKDLSLGTLVGHRGAVTCLDLADDKIVSGSDDGDIRIWSFAPTPLAVNTFSYAHSSTNLSTGAV